MYIFSKHPKVRRRWTSTVGGPFRRLSRCLCPSPCWKSSTPNSIGPRSTICPTSGNRSDIDACTRHKVKKGNSGHLYFASISPQCILIVLNCPLIHVYIKKGAFCKVGVLSSYCVPFLSYQARKAMDEFYHNMQRACVVHSLEHWEKLYADTIRPKKLLENFRIVYRAYSPHKEEEAFVVCPWMPSPCVYNRRRILPMNHQTIWSPRRCGSPSLGRNTHTPEAEVRSASSMYWRMSRVHYNW